MIISAFIHFSVSLRINLKVETTKIAEKLRLYKDIKIYDSEFDDKFLVTGTKNEENAVRNFLNRNKRKIEKVFDECNLDQLKIKQDRVIAEKWNYTAKTDLEPSRIMRILEILQSLETV